MALQTKTYSKTLSSKNMTLTLTLTENSVNTANNTSNITYKLTLKSNGSYWFSDHSHGYSVKLNGKTIKSLTWVDGKNQISLDAGKTITVCSGTTDVEHDSDGTLSDMAVAYSFYTEYTDTISGTGTMALTAISRGLIYIGNGSSYDAYEVYIGNGTSWDKYTPHIGDGTNWVVCS